jgi:hypothetical protein
MPKNKYPGKKINETDKYFESKLPFDIINNNPKINNDIIKPEYQGSLDEDRVQQMIQEYLTNPLFFKFKNKVIIGDLNNSWYCVDGQHRLEMVKILYKDHNIKDDYINFCWYKCDNQKDMEKLFISINFDSTKNKNFINSDAFDQIKITEFTKLLLDSYNPYFARKKSDNVKRYTIEEFRDKLIELNYFKNEEFSSAKDILEHIKQENNAYYELWKYSVFIKNNSLDIYYKEEHNCIKEQIIFSLKNANFLKWLQDKNEPPYHSFKKSKESITPYKKKKVWEKEFNDSETGNCPISFCKKILNNSRNKNWDCGHIISEFHGGITEPDNLRPICKNCNSSMGSKDWETYDPP